MPEFLSLLGHVQRTKFTHILLKNSHKLLLFSITEIYIGLINTGMHGAELAVASSVCPVVTPAGSYVCHERL